MLAISLLPALLALADLAMAGPFTFPSQPSLRHVTLTAQDGRPMVLTITQTRTATTTATLTPTTILAPSGPRRTGRPEEAELELRENVFAPTSSDSSDSSDSSSDSGSSSSSSSTSSSADEEDSSASSADETATNAQTPAQAVAKAQTTPPPPKNDPEVASALAQQGYSQVTYYSCVTRDATLTHCGWHVPVVKASSAASGRHGDVGRLAGAALAATLSVVLGSLVMW
ncbi:hypothetical protein J7T55_013509 [Diaporthe amygdali]|uniref:uncharacterized protein n=1 Tax=Phomopsis amygdali TaxID=1214568 RepID=UPI0022FDCB34|nr:uncharacterized protein J7T55_013509 [Diaporthe amygdali]KAJ0119272.1 hypothetical protein J7T55_013509 [Diaporthe amygdali]